MNENTNQLLEQLAVKLNTTTEYLWSVLISQAPISAATTLLYMVIATAFWFGLYKLHKSFQKNEAYDIDNPVPAIMVGIAVMLLFLFSFCLILEISNVVNGFLHPEYWALQKVMEAVRR